MIVGDCLVFTFECNLLIVLFSPLSLLHSMIKVIRKDYHFYHVLKYICTLHSIHMVFVKEGRLFEGELTSKVLEANHS